VIHARRCPAHGWRALSSGGAWLGRVLALAALLVQVSAVALARMPLPPPEDLATLLGVPGAICHAGEPQQPGHHRQDCPFCPLCSTCCTHVAPIAPPVPAMAPAPVRLVLAGAWAAAPPVARAPLLPRLRPPGRGPPAA
jgi:hypothetical protein